MDEPWRSKRHCVGRLDEITVGAEASERLIAATGKEPTKSRADGGCGQRGSSSEPYRQSGDGVGDDRCDGRHCEQKWEGHERTDKLRGIFL